MSFENFKKHYKAGLNAEELKKNRENDQFSLRKKKRYENMKKRRNIGVQLTPDVSQRVCCLIILLMLTK